MREVLKMKFDNVTIKVPISKERLLYCFKADTYEEFERRYERLANVIQKKIENELCKEVMKEVMKMRENE